MSAAQTIPARVLRVAFTPLALGGMLALAALMLSASASGPLLVRGWLGLGPEAGWEEGAGMAGYALSCGLCALVLGALHPVVAHPDPEAVDPRLSRLMDVLHLGFALNGAGIWLVGGLARLFG